MQMPQIGQTSPQQYYSQNTPPAPVSKKRMVLIGLGIVVLLVLIFTVVFSGRSKPGQTEMKSAMQSTADALAITDEYSDDLQTASTKNDIALIQILVRGNFQKLNDLYNETYKPRKKFSISPKVDSDSAEILDRARRNNTLDSEIVDVLKQKVQTAQTKLTQARKSFKKTSSREIITVSISDFNSIEDILNKPR